MKCPVCGDTEVIQLYKPDRVAFKCINGHSWNEVYIEDGGVYERPLTYKVKFEDALFPKERLVYEAVIKELDQKREFYCKAQPDEKAKALIQNCNVDEKDLYNLMIKVAAFYKQSSQFKERRV